MRRVFPRTDRDLPRSPPTNYKTRPLVWRDSPLSDLLYWTFQRRLRQGLKTCRYTQDSPVFLSLITDETRSSHSTECPLYAVVVPTREERSETGRTVTDFRGLFASSFSSVSRRRHPSCRNTGTTPFTSHTCERSKRTIDQNLKPRAYITLRYEEVWDPVGLEGVPPKRLSEGPVLITKKESCDIVVERGGNITESVRCNINKPRAKEKGWTYFLRCSFLVLSEQFLSPNPLLNRER